MKNSFKAQFSILLFLLSFSLFAQEGETRSIDRFTELKVSEGIKLIAKKGKENSITLDVYRIDAEDVITEVRGGRLSVRIAKGFRTSRSRRIAAVLTYTEDLESINVSTSAEVRIDGMLELDKLDVVASTSGTIDLKVAAKEIKLGVSTSGRIDIEGKAEELEVSASTGSVIYAYNLEVDEAYSRANTGADVRINATERLKASAGTGGTISYRGNPKTDVRTNTGGSVRRSN